ncbi:MAG: M24 family metallopeptidase [Phycisphaerales bacterium]
MAKRITTGGSGSGDRGGRNKRARVHTPAKGRGKGTSKGSGGSARRPAPIKVAAVRGAGRAQALGKRGPTPDFAARIARLLSETRKRGVEHAVISHSTDVGYLTGFLGGDSVLCVGPELGSKGAVIVSDGRYAEELEPQHTLADVVLRTKGMWETVGDVLKRQRVARFAVQAEHLSVAEYETIQRAMASGDGMEAVAISGLVGALRLVKDEAEIELIQTAIRIQEAALLAVLPTIRAGQTELEIAANLEAEMKKRGSSRCWFDSIVGARANGSLPHYRPARTKTAAGAPLLIDWGATFEGYCGDMTRTFSLGKWSKTMREIYEIVREAQEMSAAALAPGRMAHSIDRIAREHIEKHGYELPHGLGHGLGMTKEPPYLNPLMADMELRPGHVVTVEPGIYLPGIGGVRIEDLYVITETGARNFCRLPKTLEWSTLR